MTRKHWLVLGPSLFAAVGIIVSTLIAKLAAESGWWVLTGPLFLAFAILGVDVLSSRLRGKPSRPSPVALMLAGAVLLASVIVALRDPGLVKELLPVLGVASWMPLLMLPESRRRSCRSAG
jgi:hypothetical protein